ncbi:protein ARV1 [Zootermopsis nevadensis]|uniref:protein ARV1 n=1 Tax=Zootermopsis nevadensis TaxID=136037 RepID=UPI000B8EA589|nr:protein ARV1 [Zootermopsis nevadensis]
MRMYVSLSISRFEGLRMATKSNLYTCVNCGNQVQELFKQYSESVLKLVHCSQCHQVADKYIEYDPVIVMIDLSSFQNHWRLAVVLALFEAYSGWTTHRNVGSTDGNNTSPYDLFEGERSFYFECLQTVFGSAMLLLFIHALTWLRWQVHAQSRPQNYNNLVLWKSLVLSNCGKFLMIPSLIWGEIGTETHSIFVMGYTFLSQVKIYSVVSNTSKVGAGVIIFFGLTLKFYVCHMILKMKLHEDFQLLCNAVTSKVWTMQMPS